MKELEILNSETQMVAMPLDKPFRLAFGTLENLPRVYLKLKAQDEAGKMLESIGEASIDFPFSNYDAWDVYNSLKNFDLIGKTINNRKLFLTETKENNPFLSEFPAANAAFNMAIDDLYGKYLDVPVQELYGTVFRDSGYALSSIPFLENKQLIQKVSDKFSQGLIPKPKVGQDIENDFDTISTIDLISHVNQMPFVLDFNGAYESEDIILLLKKLRQKGTTFKYLLFIEQPVEKNSGISSLAYIKSVASSIFDKDIMVIADESFVNEEDAIECINNNIGLNIKIQKIGGGVVAKKIDELTKNKVDSIIGGTFPTVIARTYDQQIACILETAILPGDGWEPSTNWFNHERHFANNQFKRTKDHKFLANSNPGLGLEIAWEKLSKYILENPKDEFRKIRSDKKSDKLKITLTERASYKNLYEKTTKKVFDWNLT